MAATLQQARAALKARLVAYYEAQGASIQVYDVVPGKIEAPAVVVEPASGAYHFTFGSAGTEHTLAVHAMVALGDREEAQHTLDQMISEGGGRSIAAAVHADKTLGGTVAYADVQGYRDYGTRRFGDADYLMCTVDVSIVCHP